MRYLYAIKGCSHCDSRADCPKKLKQSEANLLDQVRIIEEGRRHWATRCKDFFRFVRRWRYV